LYFLAGYPSPGKGFQRKSGRCLFSSQLKKIKTGETTEARMAYLLTNKTSPVEIKVQQMTSLSDETISKTFNIA
jgi:hypothetical protein